MMGMDSHWCNRDRKDSHWGWIHDGDGFILVQLECLALSSISNSSRFLYSHLFGSFSGNLHVEREDDLKLIA